MIGDAVVWLTRSRWSTYGLAATRVVLGGAIALQLLLNAPDRAYTWGAGATWAEPIAEAGAWPHDWMFLGEVSGWAFDGVYALTILAALAMAVGWFTRCATLLTLVLWMCLFVMAPMLETGGDAVMRMVLFYLVFTDSGARASLDARRGRRRIGERRERRPLVPDWLVTLFNNLGVVLIAHQIVMVYVGSALWKMQSDQWTDGTAVYYPLHTLIYSPWLEQFGWLYAWAPFVLGSTWLSVVIQLAFPLLLLHRTTRMLGFLAVTGMHLMIGVLMGIMYFSLVMMAADAVLVSDRSWRQWGRRLMRRRSAPTPSPAKV